MTEERIPTIALVLVGTGVFGVLAFAAGQRMDRGLYVFRVEATNLGVLLGSVSLVAVVSVAATLVPARRAATADRATAPRGQCATQIARALSPRS